MSSRTRPGRAAELASRTLSYLAACTITICMLITGCGQRGPLTLPEETLQTEAQNEDGTQDDEQEDE